jgi:polar amino acid transport system substrate-binding protein
MKYLIPLVIILPLFIFAHCSDEKQIKPLKPLTVATGEWEPYVGENLPKNGPVAEMMSAVLAELEYVPVFKFYDWGIVERHLQAGYPSMAFPYLKSEERIKNGFKYSVPIIQLDYVLFYYNPNQDSLSQIKSLETLKASFDQDGNNMKIAKIKGYSKLSPFDDNIYYMKVNSAVEGFNLLMKDSTVQYFLESRLVGLAVLKSQELLADKDDFSYLGKSLNENVPDDTALAKNSNFHILLSPKVPDQLVADLNEAIGNLDTLFLNSVKDKILSASELKSTAVLNSTTGYPIYGYPNFNENIPIYLLPGNTKVLVMNWHETYQERITEPDILNDILKSQVKVLNGPLQGKVMWVSSKQIHLELN